MTRIISLFKNQMEAEQAVNALAAASLEDTSLYTFEGRNTSLEPELLVMPPLNAGYGPSTGTALPITTALPDLDFNSEAMRFFKRSFRKGGVLVIVEPSDDVDYVQAMNILKAQGGKVLSD